MTSTIVLNVLILLLSVTGIIFLLRNGGIGTYPVRIIPLLTWLMHVIVFCGALLVLVVADLAIDRRLLINSWSSAVLLHGVASVVMAAVWGWRERVG